MKENNREEMIDASRYAYDKDIIVHAAIELAMQYKMLEDLYNLRHVDTVNQVRYV